MKNIKKAEELGENSTPAFYINGKNIQGYNAPLLNQVLDEVKKKNPNIRTIRFLNKKEVSKHESVRSWFEINI